MNKSILYTCELKHHRQVAPPLCSICYRVAKCRSFRKWFEIYRDEYLDFVSNICNKFPEKYNLEVILMAEKQTFVQIVDVTTGKIEKIVNLKEIEALSPEEKLELARNKNLFIVTHRIIPIVKVNMKKTAIEEPWQFNLTTEENQQEKEKVKPASEFSSKAKTSKKK
ncbi:MAG: hypothetical protein WC179_03085 [Candidatus Cloacimonadaceae bacterium]|jgi:hypothetical protein|nr:hypothetical protein [Candidatus Cloacimonadota bacterium]MCB5257964.1 hypothetical protein [Candidatus Cloacimonadota bacterium]MDD5624297.1 hypothetical protein [Candidatus Cloacimonadota bacterium]MDY0111520.1 hypothetical protein [Candidatus Syntrophosphaera sp.]